LSSRQCSSLNKLQLLLIFKLYYSTRLCHLHCHYPLRACALEREITTVRYRQLSHWLRTQKYYSEDIYRTRNVPHTKRVSALENRLCISTS
jgi:hypothetical protein